MAAGGQPQIIPQTFTDVTLPGEPVIAGNLEVRLATNEEELQASQALRYDIYVYEIGAKPTSENEAVKLDRDIYDPVCDHLLVLEKNEDGGERVVGSYRLLRRGPMEKVGHFYSSTEYDISTMHNFEGNVLEGRRRTCGLSQQRGYSYTRHCCIY